MPKVTRIVFSTGATAASLGATALDKTAGLLRSLAGGAEAGADAAREAAPTNGSRGDVPVEHRDQARKLEPVVAPEEQPENPAAPAGADPEAQSGTGPVPRRISNPKAARKVRQRKSKTASPRVSRLETKQSGKGAKPSGEAEASPAELAKSGKGRQPAPMGSQDD
jgi:hypothetical protein